MPKWLVGRPPAEMEELALLYKNLLRVYAPQISQGPPAKIRCLQQLVSCWNNLLWVSGVRKRVYLCESGISFCYSLLICVHHNLGTYNIKLYNIKLY